MFGMPSGYDELDQQAQPNQYSDGNMSNVDNTGWMAPTGSGDSTLAQNTDTMSGNPSSSWTGGFTGMGANPWTGQQSTLPAAGTAIEAIGNGWSLGSIFGAGGNQQTNPGGVPNSSPMMGQQLPNPALPNQQQNNFGAAPAGFEQDKWADPNLGNSIKYQVGRMAASGMPIQEIAAKVGAKVLGNDKLQFPDGFVADIYFDEDNASGQRRVQYTDVTPAGQYKPGGIGAPNSNTPPNSQPQNPYGMDMNSLLQQMMFSAQRARKGNLAARYKRTSGRNTPTQTSLV